MCETHRILKKKPGRPGASSGRARPATRLKDVADHLGLSPATVSLVLNRSPAADAIPRKTHDRVFAAAEELSYRPNLLARSLRQQKTFSIGVLVPEISEGYAAGVMKGVEEYLSQEGYFYLLGSHGSKLDLQSEYLAVLKDRSVEGYILLASQLEEEPELPTVVVSGHRRVAGVTNVILDHDVAARLALGHLKELGHQRVAFFRGPPANADANERWRANLATAEELGFDIDPRLLREVRGVSYGEVFYREGFEQGRKLLETGVEFTALFAFNDISAIGAMKAFLDAGVRVPEDVSVIGFDDIQSAGFHNPSLTTVRQPLEEMGVLAARTLLERLASNSSAPDEVMVEPELIVRESTALAATSRPGGARRAMAG
jgi:LacI family transcriptional regulator, galactose operon repressor